MKQVVGVTEMLTGEWFTPDVAEGVPNDLVFQDVLCFEEEGIVKSFLMFTGLDGAIHVTLMGTNPGWRGTGLGSKLMLHLFQHAEGLGFTRICLMIVPPRTKPAYEPTLQFYQKHGFVVQREIPDLWQSGALELTKDLQCGRSGCP